MTSFRAMTECTVGVCKVLAITEKDRYLSYLPVAHGMDRWLGEVRSWTLYFFISTWALQKTGYHSWTFFSTILFRPCGSCSIFKTTGFVVTPVDTVCAFVQWHGFVLCRVAQDLCDRSPTLSTYPVPLSSTALDQVSGCCESKTTTQETQHVAQNPHY